MGITENSSTWTQLISITARGTTGTTHTCATLWGLAASGSDSPPSFTGTGSGTTASDCMLFELAGADTTTMLDVSATYHSGSSSGTLSSMTATTSAVSASGEYGISCFCQERSAGNYTWTGSGSGGFSALLSGNGVSSRLQTYVGAVASPASGSGLNDAGHFSTDSSAYGSGFVAVVLAAAGPEDVTDDDSFAWGGEAAYDGVHAVQITDATPAYVAVVPPWWRGEPH